MAEVFPNSAPRFATLRTSWVVVALVVLSAGVRVQAQDAYSLSPGVFRAPLVKSPFPGSVPLLPPIGTSLSLGRESGSPMAVQGVDPDVHQLYNSTASTRASSNQSGVALESTARPLSSGIAYSAQTNRDLVAEHSFESNLTSSLASAAAGGIVAGTTSKFTNSTEQIGFSPHSMQEELKGREAAFLASTSYTANKSYKYSKLDALSPEVLASQPAVLGNGGLRAYGLSGLPSLMPHQPMLKTAPTADFSFKPTEITRLPGFHSRRRAVIGKRAIGNRALQGLAGSQWSTGPIVLPSVPASVPKVPVPSSGLLEQDGSSVRLPQ